MKKLFRSKTPLISIVIPFFNEEANIGTLHQRLSKLMRAEKKYGFEVIAVEHGSVDSSFEKLKKINRKDKRWKIVQLSRNFGSADAGISAGLSYAKGDAAVIIMADLQEPPELISKFLRHWEKGYEIIYGIVKKRSSDSPLTRRVLSTLFYKVLNVLTGNIFPENVSDFRLVDKKVYTSINQMEERNLYLRGIIAWTGFKQIGVEFHRAPRFAGKSKADFLTVTRVALNGIFSFSYIPLRVATAVGLLVSLISFSMIVIEIILLIIYGRVVPGLSTLVVLTSFFFGILFLMLGIIGEYLARIYDEVKNRPIFIVKDLIGFKKIK